MRLAAMPLPMRPSPTTPTFIAVYITRELCDGSRVQFCCRLPNCGLRRLGRGRRRCCRLVRLGCRATLRPVRTDLTRPRTAGEQLFVVSENPRADGRFGIADFRPERGIALRFTG